MTEVSVVRETLAHSLADVEPPAFQAHLRNTLGDVSLTPAILTVRTARVLEPSFDEASCALHAAGVQLTYEGLRLTRSILSDELWTQDSNQRNYYLDLLAAAVLVSRGYYYLADSGVTDQAVEAARRFGRYQTYDQNGELTEQEYSLEEDFIALAVNAGADMALQTVPPSITAYGESLARDIGTQPLSEPEPALEGVEERLKTLASAPEATEVDEYDE
ncbi:hypothetical protein ACFQJ7_14000 [Halovenus rubra]|uniref:Uncharacterized protein n=2 Tax=Halovenus rubra TaxID=869890 RepID=A0ACC7DY46_9EURY|nr:hypothetical protein [Halovenus rubra]